MRTLRRIVAFEGFVYTVYTEYIRRIQYIPYIPQMRIYSTRRAFDKKMWQIHILLRNMLRVRWPLSALLQCITDPFWKRFWHKIAGSKTATPMKGFVYTSIYCIYAAYRIYRIYRSSVATPHRVTQENVTGHILLTMTPQTLNELQRCITNPYCSRFWDKIRGLKTAPILLKWFHF